MVAWFCPWQMGKKYASITINMVLDPENVSVVCGGGALQLPTSNACLVPLAATLCVRGRELVRKVEKDREKEKEKNNRGQEKHKIG